MKLPKSLCLTRWVSLAIAMAAVLSGTTVSSQSIRADGLRAAALLDIDANGVALIRAANDYDAAYLLGYVHARDRLFQMDYTRRAASGTLAELVGPAALASDVQLRTLGLRRAAQTTWSAVDPELRGQLKSYADGVNFYVRTHSLPQEYGALELTRFEPWSPVDSLVVGKALAFQLSFDLDIDYTLRLGAYQQAGAAGGFNGQALFFEDTHRVQPFDSRVSIPRRDAGQSAAKIFESATPLVTPEMMALAQDVRSKVENVPLIAPTLRPREGRGGSNWWVVSGAETQSGRPILANDPHLSLDLPSIMHEVHIVSTDSRYPTPMNVSGLTPPGAPTIVMGCTEKFCWGLTTNPLDVADTYQEPLRFNAYGVPTHTVYKGVEEPLLWVFQTYNVNQLDGVPDNARRDTSIGYANGGLSLLVPRRNNGPILSIQGSSGLSVAYTGWGATHEIDAFRRINRATNLSEFRAALQFFDVGSQNFAYADVEGNIAYFTTAETPVREDLQTLSTIDGAPPFLIRDGSGTRKNDWLRVSNRQPNQALPFEILPQAEMPFVINPASNYIANANNDPVGNTLDNNAFNQLRPGGGLFYLNFGYSSLRMGRVDRMMQSLVAREAKVTVADIQKTQANAQLLDAELMMPHLINAWSRAQTSSYRALEELRVDTRVAEAMQRLSSWDFSSPTGIREGFDPGDNPLALVEPSQAEIDASVAATIFSVWRGLAVRSVIDATMSRIGLGSQLPESDEAYVAFKHLLDTFPTRRGVGVSGVDFFARGGPTREDSRDAILLIALQDALNLLAGNQFAAAFGNSTQQSDYRWGKLHRIVFDHPLGGPFNIPGPGLYGLSNLSPSLPGVARQGGYEAVDASSHSSRAIGVNDFMFGHGPARRFIGEMTSPPTAMQAIPGGLSGVLGNELYISQLPLWLVNGYKPLPIDVAAHAAAQVQKFEFLPLTP